MLHHLHLYRNTFVIYRHKGCRVHHVFPCVPWKDSRDFAQGVRDAGEKVDVVHVKVFC